MIESAFRSYMFNFKLPADNSSSNDFDWKKIASFIVHVQKQATTTSSRQPQLVQAVNKFCVMRFSLVIRAVNFCSRCDIDGSETRLPIIISHHANIRRFVQERCAIINIKLVPEFSTCFEKHSWRILIKSWVFWKQLAAVYNFRFPLQCEWHQKISFSLKPFRETSRYKFFAFLSLKMGFKAFYRQNNFSIFKPAKPLRSINGQPFRLCSRFV